MALQRSGELTLDKALEGGQLSQYKRQYGAELLLTQLTAMFLELAASFNLKNSLTENQAVDLSSYIIKNYWHLKYPELFIFCENAKMGCYGKVYDRLDSAMIIEWLNKYSIERDYIFESRHIERKNNPETEQVYNAVLAGLRERFPEEQNYQKPKLSLAERLSDPEYRKFYRDYQIKKHKELCTQTSTDSTQEATEF